MSTYYKGKNLEQYDNTKVSLNKIAFGTGIGMLIGIAYLGITNSNRLTNKWGKLPYAVQQQTIRQHANAERPMQTGCPDSIDANIILNNIIMKNINNTKEAKKQCLEYLTNIEPCVGKSDITQSNIDDMIKTVNSLK